MKGTETEVVRSAFFFLVSHHLLAAVAGLLASAVFLLF
jgi:hypothetical protein